MACDAAQPVTKVKMKKFSPVAQIFLSPTILLAIDLLEIFRLNFKEYDAALQADIGRPEKLVLLV